MKTARVLLKIYSIKKIFIAFLTLFNFFTFIPFTHASPKILTELESNRILLNKTFNLFVTISWHGDADDYMIVPPELVFPEGVVQESSSFSSSVTKKKHLITYHYILKAHQKGKHTLQPIKIKYWGKDAKEEHSFLTDEIPFEVFRFAWWGPSLLWVIIIAAVTLVATVMVAAMVTNKQMLKKKIALDGKEGQNREYIMQKLHVCKQCKIKGDYRGFYQSTVDIAKRLPCQETAFISNVTNILEKVQFGGYKPASEEIERILRYIEKKASEIISDRKRWKVKI